MINLMQPCEYRNNEHFRSKYNSQSCCTVDGDWFVCRLWVVVLVTVTGLCAGCELLYWWRWLVCVQVVDIMRVNVDRVLERDQKLSELDSRAGKTVPLLFAQFLFSCHFVCSEFIRLRSCSVILFSLFQLPRNFFLTGKRVPSGHVHRCCCFSWGLLSDLHSTKAFSFHNRSSSNNIIHNLTVTDFKLSPN